MKHVACGGWIEIRTDPKNTAYVVHEGARKRDTGEDIVRDGDMEVETMEEREARRADAFATLEGKVEDKERLAKSKDRLEELQEVQEKQWEDPYSQNRKLRAQFRVERYAREKDGKIAGALQDKMSLGIDLLPENEEDARRAGYIEFGGEDQDKAVSKAISKPLFRVGEPPDTSNKKKENQKPGKKLKAEQLAEQRRKDLAAEVRGNTMAKLDPFLLDRGPAKPSPRMALGIKRKRDDQDVGKVGHVNDAEKSRPPAVGLVDYDSD
jgi:coiled-coil domain-containing protein 130